MAYITQVGTTTTANTNLTAATLVGTFTNTTRIRKLWVNIFADAVKGGGDYVANIRVQRAGAGSEYVSIKTTLTAAAGVTSIYFGSIPITLNATDVMKVYLLGLATDNDTTADVIVDVNEEWLNDTGAGLTSIPNSAGVTTILADYARRTGDYSTLTAALVWSYATRTLSSLGTLVTDIWAYATRTLTQSAASVAAAVTGDSITVYRGDSIVIPLTGLGSLANLSKLYFTVKADPNDADADAILQVEQTAGLLVICGAAGTAGNGAIALDNTVTGAITITLTAEEAAKLPTFGSPTYDVQIVRSTGTIVSTLAVGEFVISDDLTRATS